MITQGILKSLFEYNPLTGEFKRNGALVNNKLKNGYLRIGILGGSYAAHRLSWLYVYGKFPINMIDHINGIRADNRIENLRDVTCAINNQNRRNCTNNKKTTKTLGVTYIKSRNKFEAQLKLNGKKIYLGRFNTLEEASKKYIASKRKYHAGCTI